MATDILSRQYHKQTYRNRNGHKWSVWYVKGYIYIGDVLQIKWYKYTHTPHLRTKKVSNSEDVVEREDRVIS